MTRRKKQVLRTEQVTTRLTEAEKSIWEKKAAEEHMDTSEFVRVTINRYIFHKETEKISVDMGPVLSELKELQDLINKRDDLMDLNRGMLVENASALKLTNPELEAKILVYVGDRKMFTTQIVEYLQEPPETIIPLLIKLEKDGKLTQDKRRRWSKLS